MELCEQIESLLKSDPDRKTVFERILGFVLERFHSETGTIHRLDHENQTLYLAAQAGLPPQMLEVVKTIPVGKGIAGQVVTQGKPVSICNLQTDTGSVGQTRRETNPAWAARCACHCTTVAKSWGQSASARFASMNTRRMKRANWRRLAG